MVGLDRERLLNTYAPRLAAAHAATAARDPVDLAEVTEETEPQEPEHTGVMVAFFLDPNTAAALALTDGDCEMAADMPMSMPMGGPMEPDAMDGVDVEDADELHLTLAYLGDAGSDVPEVMLPLLLSTVQAWAAATAPITGVTSGVGFFNNADETVTYASVDCAALPTARQMLVHALAQAGLPPNSEHGFTPHITLAYGEARGAQVPRLPVTFSAVTVAYAGQRTDFPMGSPSDVAAERARVSECAPAAELLERNIEPPAAWNAVVTEVGARTFLTAPASTEQAAEWAGAPNPNPHMLWMHGRFVGAERANRNGAYWSTSDLELGRPTVSHSPLNWLHEDRHVIGTIADAKFVPAPGGGGLQLALDASGAPAPCPDPHISALSAIWRWIYPDEASIVQMASDAQVLAYSMECISEAVQCVGDKGCGQAFPYMQYAQGKTCDHLQERSSVRRLVNPTFLGGAVIVPPTRPGWAEADARVLKQAASLSEKAYDQAGRPDIPAATWEQMMAGVLSFAGQR